MRLLEVAMTHGRHRKHHAVSLLVTVAVAALAVAVVATVALTGLLSRDPPTTTKTQRDPAAERSAEAEMTRAVDDCRLVQRHLGPDLAALEPAVAQWRTHIDAMTDLVAGRITLAEASAFWEATRATGRRSLASWQSADDRYQARGVDCGTPTTASGPVEALEACAAVQAAADALLLTARETLSDWRRHIRHMDALRSGDMSPTRALHLWHGMYPQGRDGLREYDRARRDLQDLPACPLV
jgi:hypothetical protein